MDYEKEYKELKQKLQNFHDRLTNELQREMEEEIPEVKGNEDEIVRMAIINFFKCQKREERGRTKTLDSWIDWLEKIGTLTKNGDGIYGCYNGQLNFIAPAEPSISTHPSDKCPDVCVRATCVGCENYEEPKVWRLNSSEEINLYNVIEAIKYAYDTTPLSSGANLIEWIKSRLQQNK